MVVTPVICGVGMWAPRGVLVVSAMLYGTNFGRVKLLQEIIPMSLAAAVRFTAVAVMPFLPIPIKINLGVFRAGVEVCRVFTAAAI